MMKTRIAGLICISLLISACAANRQEHENMYLWLEDIEATKALEWAKDQSAVTVGTIAKHPDFQDTNGKLLRILNSKERIAYPAILVFT